MTVTFKPTLKPQVMVDSPEISFEQVYQAIEKEIYQKPKQQSDVGYYFRMYLTHSEQKPLKWVSYDSTGFIQEEVEEYFKVLSMNMKHNKKDCGATGFKIVCIGVDALNLNEPPGFVNNWCKEEWAPVNKVFVNGPKKSFLAKKGGHY